MISPMCRLISTMADIDFGRNGGYSTEKIGMLIQLGRGDIQEALDSLDELDHEVVVVYGEDRREFTFREFFELLGFEHAV